MLLFVIVVYFLQDLSVSELDKLLLMYGYGTALLEIGQPQVGSIQSVHPLEINHFVIPPQLFPPVNVWAKLTNWAKSIRANVVILTVI